MSLIKECPSSPNCVSTMTKQSQKKMNPISYSQSCASVNEKIINLLNQFPRAKLIQRTETYLHYTFKSQIFGFVDDVEFFIDDIQHLVHFRSASRTGYSDFGANKKRMNQLSLLLIKNLN
ncbi:MAG: DUF1499 domain-containing protein [Bdellovibrionales bacterium]|nr:DUF1499 domain-containing protein [Bdellovibrionales bacterium]